MFVTRILVMTLLTAVNTAPNSWLKQRSNLVEPGTASTIRWKGSGKVTGAFVLSRINLNYINITCGKLSKNMITASHVSRLLATSKLKGATNNQRKKYGYLILKLEMDMKNTLQYVTDLLLCSGRGGELWDNYKKFVSTLSDVWKLLKSETTG